MRIADLETEEQWAENNTLVIPAKAGIQLPQITIRTLDTGFHR